MTLLDTCEPLFRRICQLNHLAKTEAPTPDLPSVRREMQNLLNQTRDRMLAEPALERHWDHLEMPLIFFIDSMISESKLPIASLWNEKRLAYDYKELAGDQKFFDLLDEHLKDRSVDASARLGVFYTCVGLGFTGWYSENAEQLRPRMVEMIRRVDPKIRTEETLKLCPEAYENVDTRDLIESPPIPTKVLVSFFAALFLLFVAVDFFLYQESTAELREDLAEIISHKLESSRLSLRVWL